MHRHHATASRVPRGQRGISLIELMISLLLGLIVVGGAGAIFLSNKRVYGSTETVARIQENTRTAFELMARDLREAGGMPCRRESSTFRNFLNGGETNTWWTQWAEGLRGYDAGVAMPGNPGNRAPGTSAIDIHSGFGGDYYLDETMANDSAVLGVNRIDGLKDGEILIVCDSQFTAMFQATSIISGNVSIQHNSGAGTTPGNCNMKFFFGDPPSRAMDRCNNGGTGHRFPQGASVVKVKTYRWYIGTNVRGSRSLYRAEMINQTNGGTPSVDGATQEIAEGVTGMTLEYILPTATDYVNAAAVANWGQVSAIQITLTMEGVEGALRGRDIQGTNNAALQRTFTHVVSVRNHNP